MYLKDHSLCTLHASRLFIIFTRIKSDEELSLKGNLILTMITNAFKYSHLPAKRKCSHFSVNAIRK
jgi:hypothetical protein